MTADALSRLAAANPVPERRVLAFVPEQWSNEMLASILASEASSTSGSAGTPARRPRWLAVALALIMLLLVPAYAVARVLIDGWLTGEPAPPPVVANFDSYTPQLGFQPASGRAVRVAEDRGISLYATTNDRGTYCVATSTPDGGICVDEATARAPIAAGLMPGDPAEAHRRLVLVAGRAAEPAARAIRFTDRDGQLVERPLGSSGFFLAALPLRGSPCPSTEWRPTFEAVGETGDVVATAMITLARTASTTGGTPVCSWANGPHR